MGKILERDLNYIFAPFVICHMKDGYIIEHDIDPHTGDVVGLFKYKIKEDFYQKIKHMDIYEVRSKYRSIPIEYLEYEEVIKEGEDEFSYFA